MRRVGVIGTMVWDTIYGRDGETEPVEEWGGIAYALAALEASLPPEWRIVPLIKVGRDLAQRVSPITDSLPRRASVRRSSRTQQPGHPTVHFVRAPKRADDGWSSPLDLE